MPEHDSQLISEVELFAAELTDLVNAVFPGSPQPFTARAAEGTSTHVTIKQQPREGIELHVESAPLLRLSASYRCAWDHVKDFLAVQSSSFGVSLVGVEEPLFRYDYSADGGGTVPGAHLNVHGHRDELVLALIQAGRRHRGKTRSYFVTQGKLPRLASFHFPLGGPRFRPSLEDVIEILIREFGLDTNAGWEAALNDGRAAWREKQLRSAVRDDPETAARVLERLGYSVAWASENPRPSRRDERVHAL